MFLLVPFLSGQLFYPVKLSGEEVVITEHVTLLQKKKASQQDD